MESRRYGTDVNNKSYLLIDTSDSEPKGLSNQEDKKRSKIGDPRRNLFKKILNTLNGIDDDELVLKHSDTAFERKYTL